MKTNGPGKYDDACTLARTAAGAAGAILLIYGGKDGDGFSAQLPRHLLAQVPHVLRDVADQIEAQSGGDQRQGAPDRLTPGERFALNALHRWLHSPGGDGELTEAAQPFHDQVELECREDCERLEAEERLAWAQLQRGEVEP